MKFILIGLVLLTTACTPETEDVNQNYLIPSELSDCMFKRMGNTSGNYITVVRCPNSTVSTIQSSTVSNIYSGKVKTTTIVIDGISYVPRGKDK